MSVAEVLPQVSRLRLVALLLMASGPDVPVAHTKAWHKPGRGERTGRVGMTAGEIDAALVEREKDAEGGSIVELAAERDARRHRAFAALERALGELDDRERRLLRWAFVNRSGVGMLVRLHALAYASMAGRTCVLDDTLRALVRLDGLLPAGLVFPVSCRRQVESWEEWLAAVRSKAWVDADAKTHRLAPAALALRDLYVRELVRLGLSQRQAAVHVGVSQQRVSRILQCRDITEEYTFPLTTPETRAALRVNNGSGDERSWQERQAAWETRRRDLTFT